MDKHPLSGFEEPSEIVETNNCGKPSLRMTTSLLELLFQQFHEQLNRNATWHARSKAKVAGALRTLPFKMLITARRFRHPYVSGVCSDPDMRNEGIGNAIIDRPTCKCTTRAPLSQHSYLGRSWLYDWYSKMGYVERIVCTPPQQISWRWVSKSLTGCKRAKRLRSSAWCRKPGGDQGGYRDCRQAGITRTQNRKSACWESLTSRRRWKYMQTLHPEHPHENTCPCRQGYFLLTMHLPIDHGRVTRTDRPCGCCQMNIQRTRWYDF